MFLLLSNLVKVGFACNNIVYFRVVTEHHKDCLDVDSSEVEYTDDLIEDEEHHSSSDAEDDVDGNVHDCNTPFSQRKNFVN